MSRARIFKNGKLAGEDTPELTPADVLVDEKGQISAVGVNIDAGNDAEVIDCTDKILIPGLFDVHVHLREPGREDKETIESGAEAAINGGITGILAMPNTTLAIDSGGMVRFVLSLARDRARIPVLTAGCITKERKGEQLAEIADMCQQGAVMITDNDNPVNDPYILRRALEYARSFDLITACHCDTPTLSGDGSMNEGPTSYNRGLQGMPAMSEEICIDRDLRIAQYTEGRVHIQHVSTARGMETIRRFKEEGVRVTCEVTPQHLIFSDEVIVDYNTNYKMTPPLRTAEDKELLLQGLKDGVIDVIASNHAPHTEFEKNMDFHHAPFGITGLDTALLSLYTSMIKPGKMGWDLLVKSYSAEPRRMIGRDPVQIKSGAEAEFVVFDPNGKTLVDRNFIQSKSTNTPYLGQELDGSVDQVVLKDQLLLDRTESGVAT